MSEVEKQKEVNLQENEFIVVLKSSTYVIYDSEGHITHLSSLKNLPEINSVTELDEILNTISDKNAMDN